MARPLRIHPQNPKLFELGGRPRVLLTATEHYGSVLNRCFRFERYLPHAASCGMTVTRLFTLFREQQSTLNPCSPLKPESPDFVAPVARTGPGLASDGQPKFDLDRPDPEFFDRLHRFLTLAGELDVVVEVTLLSNTYGDSVWALNPLHPANNVSGTPAIRWPEYMTLRHPALFDRQAAHVRRIVEETRRYPHLLYEICNEPGGAFPGSAENPTLDEVNDWQRALARVIREADSDPPHLIAWQEAFSYQPWEQPSDLSFAEPGMDVVNMHPLPNTSYRGTGYEMGPFMGRRLSLRAVRDFCLATYHEPRPLNYDEDNSATLYRDPTGWTIHRKRAWVTLLSGAHYDCIDFTRNAHLETGTEDARRCLHAWFRHLSAFVHGLDLVRARPQPEVVRAAPPHTLPAVLAVPGAEYAVYLADARELEAPGHGEPVSGALVLDLPPGAYRAACYSPITGEYSPAVPVTGGLATRLDLLPFRHDVAVLVRRAGSAPA
jgi:hypothetical protein